MYDSSFSLPWFISHWWLFGIFIVSCTIFHVLFVFFLPLTSIRWKQVDYAWLAMALLGITGSLSGNRAVIAENLQSMATARSASEFHQVKNAVDFGTSIAVCREFVTSPASPPPDVMAKTQREFDQQCAWFKKVAEGLKVPEKGRALQIDLMQMAGPHPLGGEEWAYSRLEQSVAGYNESLEDLRKLNEAKSIDNIEEFLRFFAPVLIAVALALRITKVTGEVALERSRQSPNA